MKTYKWILLPAPPEDKIQKLSQALNLRRALTTILLQRNIQTFQEAKAFFRPSLKQLHDPFLMKDMSKAVQRLQKAISEQEKIMIYGDYDVDGTTSVALVYNFLKEYTSSLSYHVPDRYTEGYGLSYIGINRAKTLGCCLIITLDCGITACEKVAYAKKQGIDCIICDHHLPPKILPKAFAILNAKQYDCLYPYKELTGCGVGFKLMYAFALKQNIDLNKVLKFLDLVAVSTACDIVPIDGENRVLMYFGLKQLKITDSIGLKSLGKYTNVEINTVSDLVFRIGPRINAAGRISHAQEAVNLLISKEKNICDDIARIINHYNEERKNVDKQITEEALKLIEDYDRDDLYTTVLYDPNWHKGVIGIVASRCIEHYYKPTIILTQSGDYIVGSARSIKGFNMYDALEYCRDVIDQFGGHYFAAGLKLKPENLKKFKSQFEEYAHKKLQKEQLITPIKIDTILQLDDITNKFYKVLIQMEPFGPSNMAPVFQSNNVYLVGQIKVMKEKHLKFRIQQQGQKNIFTVVAFNMVDYKSLIQHGKPFSVCYQVKENIFAGYSELQLYLKYLRS